VKPRSKKYYESRKPEKGDKKGSATGAGYDEQNEKTIKEPKKNPAPPEEQDHPMLDTPAAQDANVGENDSEKNTKKKK